MIIPIFQLGISDYIGIAAIVTPLTVALAGGMLKVVADIAALKQDIKNIKEQIINLGEYDPPKRR